MRLLPLHTLCAVTVLMAQVSLQGRLTQQQIIDRAAELFPPDASLLDIIKNRPGSSKGTAGEYYRAAFANHPEVSKLLNLKDKAFVDHAVKLRSSVAEQKGGIKNKFSRSLERYMKDNDIDAKLQEDVKAKLEVVTILATQRHYKAKVKHLKGSQAWNEAQAKYNAARLMKKKERKAAYKEGDSRLENHIKEMNLPSDASAADVEKAVRGFVIDSNLYTTGQLRKFLKARYHPVDVDAAMTNRTYHLNVASNTKEYQKNRHKRRKMKAGSSSVDSQLATSMDSTMSGQYHGHSPLKNDKGQSSKIFDYDVDPTAKQFHEAEWWDHLY